MLRFPGISLPLVCLSTLTANRTASQARSRGKRPQLAAYPRLQNSSCASRVGTSPSCPGAVQCPLHPHPSGSRPGCGQAPSSSLATGMKYGQAILSSRIRQNFQEWLLYSSPQMSAISGTTVLTKRKDDVCSNLTLTEN